MTSAAKNVPKKKISPIVLFGGGFIALCLLAIVILSQHPAQAPGKSTTVANLASASTAGITYTPGNASDNKADIIAARYLLRHVNAIQTSSFKMSEQLNADVDALNKGGLSDEKNDYLHYDMKMLASSATTLNEEAAKVQVPEMQNSQARDLASKAVADFKLRENVFHLYAQAAYSDDAASANKLTQASADAISRELNSFKDMCIVLGTTLDDIIPIKEDSEPANPFDTDPARLRPFSRLTMELDNNVLELTQRFEVDYKQLNQDGISLNKVKALTDDMQSLLSRLDADVTEIKSAKIPPLRNQDAEKAAEDVRNAYAEQFADNRQRLDAIMDGNTKSVHQLDEAIDKANEREAHTEDKLVRILNVGLVNIEY